MLSFHPPKKVLPVPVGMPLSPPAVVCVKYVTYLFHAGCLHFRASQMRMYYYALMLQAL
jgi:hypothetical protein